MGNVIYIMLCDNYGCPFSTRGLGQLERERRKGVHHFGNRSMFNLHNYFCLIYYTLLL